MKRVEDRGWRMGKTAHRLRSTLSSILHALSFTLGGWDCSRVGATRTFVLMRHGWLVILYVLALVVAFIAARVEYLNAAAGHYLPRTGLQDVGKWRTAFLDEKRWRLTY